MLFGKFSTGLGEENKTSLSVGNPRLPLKNYPSKKRLGSSNSKSEKNSFKPSHPRAQTQNCLVIPPGLEPGSKV